MISLVAKSVFLYKMGQVKVGRVKRVAKEEKSGSASEGE
jgi:hypothetical protein